MQVDFHQLQKDCIALGIIKVSDKDGSLIFNANLTKIYTLVQLYLGKQAQTTQAVSGANNRSRLWWMHSSKESLSPGAANPYF